MLLITFKNINLWPKPGVPKPIPSDLCSCLSSAPPLIKHTFTRIKPLETLGYITDGHVGAGFGTELNRSSVCRHTPHLSASFRRVTSPLLLRSWLSGAVLNTWSWHTQTVEMESWTSGRNQKNQTQEQVSPSSHHQTLIPGITIFSFPLPFLASASGACFWQNWGGGFFPQALRLLNSNSSSHNILPDSI